MRRNAFFRKDGLDHSDICSSETFLSLLDVKGYSVAFTEGFKSRCIDCAVMHEYIRAIFLLNEAEPFLVVKPFYSSISHSYILLS